jgi:O-antigen/teichoic acid export membrane protein
MLNKLFRNSFLQGTFLITISTFLVSFLNYCFNLLVSRGLTLANYGEYFSALSYINLITIPFGAFGTIFIRKMGSLDAQHRREYAQSFETWLYQRLVAFFPLIALVGGGAFVALFYTSNLQMVSIAFILISTLLSLMQIFYTSVLQAYKAFAFFGVLMVSASLLKLAGGFGVTFLNPDLFFLYLVMICATLFHLLLGHFLIGSRQKSKEVPIELPQLHRYVLRKSILMPLLTTLGFIGLANVDVILVKKFMSANDVGLYSAWILLSKIIFFVSAPIASIGYIYFTGKEHKHQANLLLFLISLMIISIGVSAVIFYEFFSGFAIRFFFDERFLPIQGLLWIGGVYGMLYSLIMLFSQYFIAKNSYASLCILVALGLQMLTLTFFHSSLAQVMMINVGLAGTLVVAYVIATFYHNKAK